MLMLAMNEVDKRHSWTKVTPSFPTLAQLVNHSDTGEEMFADALFARAMEDIEQATEAAELAAEIDRGNEGGHSDPNSEDEDECCGSELDHAHDLQNECETESARALESKLLDKVRRSANSGEWNAIISSAAAIKMLVAVPVRTVEEVSLISHCYNLQCKKPGCPPDMTRLLVDYTELAPRLQARGFNVRMKTEKQLTTFYSDLQTLLAGYHHMVEFSKVAMDLRQLLATKKTLTARGGGSEATKVEKQPGAQPPPPTPPIVPCVDVVGGTTLSAESRQKRHWCSKCKSSTKSVPFVGGFKHTSRFCPASVEDLPMKAVYCVVDLTGEGTHRPIDFKAYNSAKKSRGPTPLTTESNIYIAAVDAAMKIWELAAKAVGAPAACYPIELQKWSENKKKAERRGSSNATI
jgi:hypothetical protein